MDSNRCNLTHFLLSRSYDSLTVRNGSSGTAPLLGKFCGTTFQSVISSTVSSMFVQFTSDGSLSYRGFNASYELIGESASPYFSSVLDHRHQLLKEKAKLSLEVL